jgi:hypothetical protein
MEVIVRTQILCGLLALNLLACGEDVGPLETGQLELSWQISPRGCGAAEVDTVQIHIKGPQSYREVVACAENTITLRDLIAGTYSVTIDGLDNSGIARFTAEPQRLVVRPDRQTRSDLIRLTAKPSEVKVEWRFADGRVCGAHGAEVVDVTVFDKLDYEITSQQFSCNDGMGLIPGLMAGTYLIEVVAAGHEDFFQGIGTIAVSRGDLADTIIELAPIAR